MFAETLAVLETLSNALSQLAQKKAEWRGKNAKHKLLNLYKRVESLEDAGKEVLRHTQLLARHGKLDDASEIVDSFERLLEEYDELSALLNSEKIFVDALKIYAPEFFNTATVALQLSSELPLRKEVVDTMFEWSALLAHDPDYAPMLEFIGMGTITEDPILQKRLADIETGKYPYDLNKLSEIGGYGLQKLGDAKEKLKSFITATYDFKEFVIL